MDGPAAPIPLIDLYSGAGGLSLGLSRAGLQPVAAVEAHPNAARTYQRLHNVEVIESDIAKLSFRSFRDRVRVVAAGPPCQPFSVGGLRRGNADDRDGFPELLRALQEIRPEAFVIENVAGLGRGRMRSYLDQLIDALEHVDKLGYIVTAKVLAAVDHGVPQRRERLFIVGTRERAFVFPEPTHGPGRRHRWANAGSVIDPEKPNGEPNPAIVTYAKRPDLRPSPFDGHLYNGGGRPIDLEAPARTVLASAGGNKAPFVDTLGIVHEYHAYLVRGGRPRGGRVPGTRRITVAESAALQTFPTNMTFDGPRTVQQMLVGNAVPPRLAEAVGHAIVRALASDPLLSARAA